MQDMRDLVRNEPGVTVGNNPNPRRLPELRDPRHRRQPRAASCRRHARARLPRQQRRRRHLHPRAARPRGHQAGRDHPRPRLGALRLRRDRRRRGLHHQGSRRLHRSRAARTSTPASRAPTAAPTRICRDLHRRRCARAMSSSSASTRGATAARLQPAQSSLGTNPTTWYNNNFLAKLVFRPTDVDTIRLTGDYYPGHAEHRGPVRRRRFPGLFAQRLRRMGPGLHPAAPHQRPMGARRAGRLHRSHRLPGLLHLGHTARQTP